jgi:16S rRNA (cytosine967-C5)-methyltransferase
MGRRPGRRSSPATFGLAPRNARGWAMQIVETYRQTGSWVQEQLQEAAARGMPAPQRGFVTELVCGTIRRASTLRAIAQHCLSRPWDSLEPPLQTLLSLGVYQLIFMDHVPAYAAVDETVQLAKEIGQSRWVNFANGVLRGVTRLCPPIAEQDSTTSPSHSAAEQAKASDDKLVLSARAVPLTPHRVRWLQADVFPDPQSNRVPFVAAAFSLPVWLVERWSAVMSADDLIRVAMWSNQVPRLSLRVNRIRVTTEHVLKQLSQAGHACHPGVTPDAVCLETSAAIEELPGYAQGWWTIQDQTAMQAVPRLSPPVGGRVWDMCAAPGTKTTHLAEWQRDSGRILATDLAAGRLERITDNARRLGLESIQTQRISGDGGDLPDGPFDAILVDAPCSNTGVLARRPEARWRISLPDLQELPLLQTRLLKEAARRLAPQGRLLYSTCSIEPAENQDVVRRFLATHPQWKLEVEHGFLPGPDGDGGFQAVLTKTASEAGR